MLYAIYIEHTTKSLDSQNYRSRIWKHCTLRPKPCNIISFRSCRRTLIFAHSAFHLKQTFAHFPRSLILCMPNALGLAFLLVFLDSSGSNASQSLGSSSSYSLEPTFYQICRNHRKHRKDMAPCYQH